MRLLLHWLLNAAALWVAARLVPGLAFDGTLVQLLILYHVVTARAVADNPALAESSGINVDQVIRVVWTAGGAVAALAGVLLGLAQNVNYMMGLNVLLLIFAGVTLGGLGTAFGALVGSLMVGLFIQLSTLWVPTELKTVGAMLVLILVMLVRPQGILGRRERIG